MFFEQLNIDEILNCEKCKHRLDEPRMLPCGKTICTECASSLEINLNVFKCILCDENHFVSENSLPINQLIYNLLMKQPVDVSRGAHGEKLKYLLRRLESDIIKIPNQLHNACDYIEEYYMDLENEIQLSKEELIQAVEKYHGSLSKKISECRFECLSRMKLNKLDENQIQNSENILNELISFRKEWSNYLRNTNIDDKLLCEANELGQKLIEKSNEQKNNLDCFVFEENQLFFQKGESISLSLIIGSLKKRYLTSLMTIQQENDLFKLCNLNSNGNWSLVYKATRDGFSSRDFHSKCDSKKNTLVIIKSTNGYVFGGYTQHDWSGKCYKTDHNAFIFSFINNSNKPVYLKVSNPDKAIYCNNSYGATFGGDSDIYICNMSNNLNSSRSNLSNYSHPTISFGSNEAKSFIAGSYNFLTSEIIVLSLNDEEKSNN